MTDKTKAAVTGFVIGAAAGAIVGFATARLIGDEDRPPIVVKGGSLVFESAKRWRRSTPNGNEWQPNHPEGKTTNSFQVVFLGGSGSCSPVFNAQATISYVPDDGAAVTFTVRVQPDTGGGGDAPTIVGPDLEQEDENGPAPRLVYKKAGRIAQVVAGSSTCASPVGVILRPLK